jgi:hypothetical protein
VTFSLPVSGSVDFDFLIADARAPTLLSKKLFEQDFMIQLGKH